MNDGGPAFARAGSLVDVDTEERDWASRPLDGMTLRQYIAIEVMKALIGPDDLATEKPAPWRQRIREWAFAMADEMIAGENEHGG